LTVTPLRLLPSSGKPANQARDDLQLPDARFGLYNWALISDHQRHQPIGLSPSVIDREAAAGRVHQPAKACNPVQLNNRWADLG
jgi:hypothetical protein